MFEIFRQNPEEKIKNEINRVMENSFLDNKPLTNFTNSDRCADVCGIVEDELIKNYWFVSSRRKTFDDFSDIINSSPILFHVFLIAMKNERAFIVDPTFGQFGKGSNIFIHEITGKNIDVCMKKLKSLGLSDKVFSFFVNQSLEFLSENNLF